MEAILKFDLSDQEGRTEHMRCVKALQMAVTLWDIDQYLRGQIKYAPDSMNSEVYDMLQEVRDKLHETMSANSIDLDELLK
jgi:hypothetical protein